jgi:hypothetical protein
METFTESEHTVIRTWVKPSRSVVTITIYETVPLSNTLPRERPTVTSTVAVTRHPTDRKQHNGTALTWSNTFSNVTPGIEATTPTITTATQPSLAESYDLRSFPTDVPVGTLTQGGQEPALAVTDSAQHDAFSTVTVAPTVWVTAKVFADETSTVLQAYDGSSLTWSNTFSNTTSVTEAAVASATQLAPTDSGYLGFTSAEVPVAALAEDVPTSTIDGIDKTTVPDTDTTTCTEGDQAVGMTNLTSTASVASATSTVTLTDTTLVIPVQANNTQPSIVPGWGILPYADNSATESTGSPVSSPYDEPLVSIQTTMPTESIQPPVTAPALPYPSAVTAYDSIHIPHGHPPLISSVQGQRNWNTSTNCTKSGTQGNTGSQPNPSSFLTATTSRVFIDHPPSLSGYSNGTSTNTNTSLIKLSTPTYLVTASAATRVEILPPSTVPLNSCSPEIWGRPGCLSTPTCFFDAASTLVGHQVQGSPAASVSSVVLAHTET